MRLLKAVAATDKVHEAPEAPGYAWPWDALDRGTWDAVRSESRCGVLARNHSEDRDEKSLRMGTGCLSAKKDSKERKKPPMNARLLSSS